LVTELTEGGWGRHDEFQRSATGEVHAAPAGPGLMPPGPLPVPELDLADRPPRADVRPSAGCPSAGASDGTTEPPWWAVFDTRRFPQPAIVTGRAGTRVGTGGMRPVAVPEMAPVPAVPWPAPVLPGDDAVDPVGWWLASDGRWYPPDDGSPFRGRPAADPSRRPHRALRTAGVVAAACAVVVGGAVVGLALRPTSVDRPGSAASAGGAAVPASTAPGRRVADPTTTPSGAATPAVGPSRGATAGTGAPASAPAAATTPTTAPPAPAPQAPSGVVFQYESATTPTTVAQLAASPGAFASHSVAFTGTIVAFAVNDSGGAEAMYVSEPGAPSTVVLVQLSPYDDVTQITTGDTVTIWGDATGQVDYANTVGQPSVLTNVNQVYLADRTSGYQDTGDPSPS
jgi:hypothetical protein